MGFQRHEKGKVSRLFNELAQEGLRGPHVLHGALLTLLGKKPVFFTSKAAISDEEFVALDQATQQGKLCQGVIQAKHYDSVSEDYYFYCQPDKVDDMQELISFYKSFWAKEINSISPAMHRRIGEILGYTENDIALFLKEKYTEEEIQLLDETNDLRRNLRYQHLTRS